MNTKFIASREPTQTSSNDRHAVRSPATNGGTSDEDARAEEEAINFWTSKITTALGNSAGWLVQTGQHLIEAKQRLRHGHWLRLFDPGRLRFSLRTAQMLMKIARHSVLRKSQYLAYLPPSLTTLHELAQGKEETIE